MDDYELLSRVFLGWSLSDIKNLSKRERKNWVDRSTRLLGG